MVIFINFCFLNIISNSFKSLNSFSKFVIEFFSEITLKGEFFSHLKNIYLVNSLIINFYKNPSHFFFKQKIKNKISILHLLNKNPYLSFFLISLFHSNHNFHILQREIKIFSAKKNEILFEKVLGVEIYFFIKI